MLDLVMLNYFHLTSTPELCPQGRQEKRHLCFRRKIKTIQMCAFAQFAFAQQLEGQDKQETDNHWNSEDGTGSFNWRMKWPIEIPYKNPRFKLAIWDKDLVNADDVIAEAVINLQQVMNLRAQILLTRILVLQAGAKAQRGF